MTPDQIPEAAVRAVEQYLEILASKNVPINARNLLAAAINAMPDAQAQIAALKAERDELQWAVKGFLHSHAGRDRRLNFIPCECGFCKSGRAALANKEQQS